MLRSFRFVVLLAVSASCGSPPPAGVDGGGALADSGSSTDAGVGADGQPGVDADTTTGCTSEIECLSGQYCNGSVCVDDVCVQGSTRCVGQDLFRCSATGDGEEEAYACTATSTCSDDGMGSAVCDCGDDWDCPSDTRCEGRACVGTGVAPTCLLAPEPFVNALPVNEITWGGSAAQPRPLADSKAFPRHNQVTQQVLVANLDDDNGDGLIDDRDIPEIIFNSYCDSAYTTNGVIRAIHGGGPNKGEDFFATCGAVVWHEGDALPADCSCSSAELDPTASIAVGDLNYDGVPEIVAITEDNEVRLFSNTGEPLALSVARNYSYGNPAPSLANVDNNGNAEVIVGRVVFALDDDGLGGLQFGDLWAGTSDRGGHNNQGPVSCVSNIIGDNRQEIVAGGTAYSFPAGPSGAVHQSDCTGAETGDEAAWCSGTLPILWNSSVNDGFCSIGDVWGADPGLPPGPANPLDGVPEVIVVSSGDLYVLDATTGAVITTRGIPGDAGGPPNLDDFDGDGFPEAGTAGATDYLMFDFQAPTTGGACDAWTISPSTDMQTQESVNATRSPPATSCTQDSDCGDVSTFACNEQTQTCICLHNGWRRRTEDDSSRVTGSSVFDFNGDGAAEVVYNDECRFRIYDGLDGTVYMREPSESRTRIEYPIVADVDNDGNAEIVFATSNESGYCSQNLDSQYNNGIEVWGDQNDFWVSARRIWNQHAYSVTNITEDGTVPLIAPKHWVETNDRQYNVYRSNPRNIGIAPDLVITGVQFATGGTCGELGDTIDIVVQVENRGDVRGGAGSVLGLYGDWTSLGVNEPLYADSSMTPLTFALPESLDPGGVWFVTLQYDIANNSPNALPDNITTIVDDPSFNPPNGMERECDENNSITTAITSNSAGIDLRVALGTAETSPECPMVPTTVFNDGGSDASNVLVRYYAGDPTQGGTALHEETFASVPGGQSVVRDVVVSGFPGDAAVTIYAVVDPDNSIAECNDGNNTDSTSTTVQCLIVD